MNQQERIEVPKGNWRRWLPVFGVIVLVLLLVALGLQISKGTDQGNLPKSGVVSTPSASGPDTDVPVLVGLAEQAMQLAQKQAPDAVIVEIVTDLNATTVRFTDAAATKEVNVDVPGIGAPPAQWKVSINLDSPFLGRPEPGIKLSVLKVGPKRVAQAITQHWPGCKLSHVVLYLEGNNLVWLAFCDTAEGQAAGSMDNQTGTFHPSDVAPAPRPVTATPVA